METKSNSNSNSVGAAAVRYFEHRGRFTLESEAVLDGFVLAYETYGTLSESRDNVILICHALSGDAHAAGLHEGASKPGWWDDMIGPGKAFDTDRYFVICSNVLGGCKGSTGPSSINRKTGKPFLLTFPIITIADMVNSQALLLDHLGIERLLCVTGGSMGGMQALQWCVSYPDRVLSCIPIATTYRHSALQIAFDEVGRQSIMADPKWKGGSYGENEGPDAGLAVARMVGHITYMSDKSMERKFGRSLKKKEYGYVFTQEFEVEGYLRYRGDSFIQRFDANSYLYITKSMDYFDLQKNRSLAMAFSEQAGTHFLIIAFSSDWLYPPYQSREIVKALKMNGIDVTYCEITSDYGHDAFLLEFEEETILIGHFLEKVMRRNGARFDPGKGNGT
jgi:homoserine O-acetyltransferase